jgi:hypothetical protein
MGVRELVFHGISVDATNTAFRGLKVWRPSPELNELNGFNGQ